MTKKTLSLFLALLLCLSCLPLGAGAAGGTQAELEEFLTNFAWMGEDYTYDPGNANVPTAGSANFLEALLHPASCYAYDDALYPGEKRQIVDYGARDPLGKFPYGYIKVRTDRMDWVLENIFNVPREKLSAMKQRMLSKSPDAVYERGGYYYSYWGGIGGGYEAKVIETQQKNGLTLVYYRFTNTYYEDWQYAYAVMEKKTLDGNTYWTMHYNTRLKDGRNPIRSGGFADIPAGSYFTDPVKWAVEKGITSGTGTATFSPNASCTRGQIVTFLWNAAGKPEPTGSKNPFSDVRSTDYYYKAVLWAVGKGITSGTDSTHFSPNKACTRGEAVTFLWRSKGQPYGTGSSFKDVPGGSFYKAAVDWAVANGITSGTGNRLFSPNTVCTRGQIVTFLYRAANVPQADPLDRCLQTYASFLRTYKGEYDDFTPRFQLIYLDEDNIPELVVADGTFHVSAADLYCYMDGTVKAVDTLGVYGMFQYVQKGSGICVYDGHMGYETTMYFFYKNGGMTLEKRFDYGDFTTGEDEGWHIDGIRVTKEVFDHQMALYETLAWSWAGYGNGTAINEYNIQRMLNDPGSVMG